MKACAQSAFIHIENNCNKHTATKKLEIYAQLAQTLHKLA